MVREGNMHRAEQVEGQDPTNGEPEARCHFCGRRASTCANISPAPSAPFVATAAASSPEGCGLPVVAGEDSKTGRADDMEPRRHRLRAGRLPTAQALLRSGATR